jgi:hypothetical protein
MNQSVSSQIYKFIKGVFKNENTKQLSYNQLELRLIGKGYSLSQINKAISEYSDSSMLLYSREEDYIIIT